MERARDLFKTAIGECLASEKAKAGLSKLYTQYAHFEESNGLGKNVMQIFQQAVKTCPSEDKLRLLTAWATKAQEFYGVAKVREIYQSAIEEEPPEGMVDADVR